MKLSPEELALDLLEEIRKDTDLSEAEAAAILAATPALTRFVDKNFIQKDEDRVTAVFNHEISQDPHPIYRLKAGGLQQRILTQYDTPYSPAPAEDVFIVDPSDFPLPLADEIQIIHLIVPDGVAPPPTGQVKLTFRGDETAAILAADVANAGAWQSALEALGSIGAFNVLCSIEEPFPGYLDVYVQFTNDLGNQAIVDMIEVTENTLEDSTPDPVDTLVQPFVIGSDGTPDIDEPFIDFFLPQAALVPGKVLEFRRLDKSDRPFRIHPAVSVIPPDAQVATPRLLQDKIEDMIDNQRTVLRVMDDADGFYRVVVGGHEYYYEAISKTKSEIRDALKALISAGENTSSDGTMAITAFADDGPDGFLLSGAQAGEAFEVSADSGMQVEDQQLPYIPLAMGPDEEDPSDTLRIISDGLRTWRILHRSPIQEDGEDLAYLL